MGHGVSLWLVRVPVSNLSLQLILMILKPVKVQRSVY